jgi:transcriptional regulator with XRE-family HTH domain
MEKVISDIQETMKSKKITEQWIADKTNIPQSTVHRIVSNQNKKLDLPKIRVIQEALGISEQPLIYGVSKIVREVTREQEELLICWEQLNNESRVVLLATAKIMASK